MKYAALINFIEHGNYNNLLENIAKDINTLLQIFSNNTLLENLPSELQYLLLAHPTQPQGQPILIRFIPFEPYSYYESFGNEPFIDKPLPPAVD